MRKAVCRQCENSACVVHLFWWTIYSKEGGWRVIGISGSLIWSETRMELIFSPCGEFQWSQEDPVSQIQSPHLHAGTPGIFKVCSDATEMVGCGNQLEAIAPIQSLVKLQPWFLSLRWKTCLRQNCSLGSCACSEGLTLGQNTLLMIYSRGLKFLQIIYESLDWFLTQGVLFVISVNRYIFMVYFCCAKSQYCTV